MTESKEGGKEGKRRVSAEEIGKGNEQRKRGLREREEAEIHRKKEKKEV